MARVLKVFGSVEERKQLAAKHKLLADYDAFTLLEVADQHAKAVARSHRSRRGQPTPSLRGGEVTGPRPSSLHRAIRRPHQKSVVDESQESRG